MMGAIATFLRPVFEPLLKLRVEAPQLPEGAGAAQRILKPSTSYLSYRYFGVALAGALKLLYVSGISLAIWLKVGVLAGAVTAGCLTVLVAFIDGLVLVATRVDWDLRHYIVGERSLRVRAGAFVQREVTLTFANIQNVEVTQGPLERLFKFKSLKVTTAGGGSAAKDKLGGGSHDAVLAGLDNADEIRDLILAALRRRQDTGLGDADDAPAKTTGRRALLLEVLEAARALRAATG